LYPEYHWPHCPNNPVNLSGKVKTGIEAKFTKSELATIAAHGPVADKPISRKKRASASNTHTKKGKATRGQS
jgi:hypothetical protein